MNSGQNINSEDYWNGRFVSGHWEAMGGFQQTRAFAESQVRLMKLPADFSGAICDFGCGAGDAIPVYREAFPNAKLVGIDFSNQGIKLCQERYGDIANFVVGGVEEVPICDVVVSSNVIEHVEDDIAVVASLARKCKQLFIVVPYREHPLSSEHVRSYDEMSLSQFLVVRRVVFPSRGWSEFGLRLVVRVWFGNVLRYILRRPLRQRKLQMLIEISGNQPS